MQGSDEPNGVVLPIKLSAMITRDRRRKHCYNVNVLSRFSYSSLKISDSAFGGHRLTSSRMGVSVIRFDKYGALFAVGGTNGILRVYDFDECLFHMHLE
jgi:hypothetical protein